jgi:hypothetical protein
MRSKPALTPLKQAQNVLAMQWIFTIIGCVLLVVALFVFDIDFPGVLLFGAPLVIVAVPGILVAHFQLEELRARLRAPNPAPTPDN